MNMLREFHQTPSSMIPEVQHNCGMPVRMLASYKKVRSCASLCSFIAAPGNSQVWGKVFQRLGFVMQSIRVPEDCSCHSPLESREPEIYWGCRGLFDVFSLGLCGTLSESTIRTGQSRRAAYKSVCRRTGSEVRCGYHGSKVLASIYA